MIPHRNELVDPKFFEKGESPPRRILVDTLGRRAHHVDFVGALALFVRSSMLRESTKLVATAEAYGGALADLVGTPLAEALTQGDVSKWGHRYEVTESAKWFEPTYDVKRRRWVSSRTFVRFNPERGPIRQVSGGALHLDAALVLLLWPWLGPMNRKCYELRWNPGTPEKPAVLAEVVVSLSGKPSGVAYPMALVMPGRVE